MELTDREYEVVTNVYGDEMPRDVRKIETEQLWKMHDQVTDAVQLSHEDDDIDSLGILLPLERKIVHILAERV